MLNLNLNWVSEAIKSLKDWWPVVKSNFQAIQNNYNNHAGGTADKHNAQHITYSGNVAGATNVKEGLDKLRDRVEQIITTPAESVSAQEIIDARGGRNTLGTRLDEIEQIMKPITSFGAKPDDPSFDNFSAIQQAFLNGGKIKISKGKYYIKTDSSIIIPSNTKIVFDEGAEIIIDTGYTDVMVNHPFRILPGTENVTIRNFKAKGYQAPTLRGGADGFIDIRGAKNIRFEGKTHIENANTVFLFVWDTDGLYIEDFYGKQCNADGVFIRRTKNVKIGKVVVENVGDDGLSVGYDCYPLLDGSSNPENPYDVSLCAENVYIDSLEVRGKSLHSYSVGSAGLYVCSAKNVYIKELIVEDRGAAFRTHIGYNQQYPGGLYAYNINIDKIIGYRLEQPVVKVRGYVTDDFDSNIYDSLINIGTIISDNSYDHILDVMTIETGPGIYIRGRLSIDKIVAIGSLPYDKGIYIRNYKDVDIKKVIAEECSLIIIGSNDSDNISIDDIQIREVTIYGGSRNIKFGKLKILNALKRGILCSSPSGFNTVQADEIYIDGFDMNNEGMHGIWVNNSEIKVNSMIIYNKTATPAAVDSIYIAQNSNVNIKTVYTEWQDGTDRTRYAVQADDPTAIFTFDEYSYKNGSNVVKTIKNKSGGPTANRPTENLYIGRQYFDSTLGMPIWWDGSSWKDVNGITV